MPLALMSLGLDPNTNSQSDFNHVRSFLLSVRKGVTTIDSSAYINDAIAGKIIVSQGWNSDVRRIVQGRKKQGDIAAILPHAASEIWADNWAIPVSAPHPVAAHAWINWLLTPSTAVTEMNYHNYRSRWRARSRNCRPPSALTRCSTFPELHEQLPLHP